MKPIILLFTGLAALCPPLHAQLDEYVPPAPACELPPAPFEGYLYVPPPVAPAQLSARQLSTVNVNFLAAGEMLFGYTCAAWPADAQAAMNYAATIWGSLVSSPYDINIDACWAQGMASGVLGAAGAASYIRLTNNQTMETSWYPAALAEALLNDPMEFSTEIRAIFNAGRSDWYFGTDGAVPSNQVDFVTVALHELGHGLGFAGFNAIDDGSGAAECEGLAGQGCYGADVSGTWYPDIYTRQVEDDGGIPLTDLGNPSLTIANLLTSGEGVNGQLFLGGSSLLSANGGAPARLYTPSTYKPGSTYSHFDLSTFGSELMKPQLGYGQAIHDPGLSLNLLEGLGWPVDFSALPVTWVSFEAREGKEGIALHWETGAEENNAGFDVQRSRDGIDWETLGFVEGRGTGAIYEFRDAWPFAGLNYYRLQQVDYDGKTGLSRMAVAYYGSREEVKVGIFPNPAKERLTVAHAGFSEPQPVAITDMLGRMQYRGLMRSSREIVPLTNLPAGTYWLRVGEELPLPFVKL
ncbi:MAG: zinc-dependent metalloprotease [Phaeodactylibacter sp.]|nr:zinc-dependent metalloprotease [Phaeodactylibacter sp.]MCB9298673.1 T9SS type A sorting domain-containing protein [Lewinellaceae bacterium]